MVKNKSRLIFGTGLSSVKTLEELTLMCSVAIDNGIMAFDTAPSYRTEDVLGESIKINIQRKGLNREQLHIQTKIDPIQMYNGHIEDYFAKKLSAMGLTYVDALLIHWPVYKYFRKTWDELQSIKKQGMARRIGICNLRIAHLHELQGIGIIPEILQIERHPLNTFERECEFCRQNHIELQAYSPLCKMNRLLLNSPVLKELAERKSANIGQIIMKWHLATGVIPVFTTKKPERIEQYADIDGIDLSEEEIAQISSLNVNHKMYLESLICPGF